MKQHSVCLAALLWAAALTACGGGGSGSPEGGPGHAPVAPDWITAHAGDGKVDVAWSSVWGADEYALYWDTAPGVDPSSANRVTAPSQGHEHLGLTNGQPYYYVVRAVNGAGEGPPSPETSAVPQPAGATQYDPPWAGAVPASVTTIEHDFALTDEQNGAALKQAIGALSPGDMLEVGAGRWSIDSFFTINRQGTAAQPIWIVAKAGEKPVITRPNAGQNVVNMGSGGAARYVVLRGLEITGGSEGLKLFNCSNVWIDRCHIHHVGAAGLSANSADTDRLYLTRNVIHDTAGTGEGMYLGANNGVWVMSRSVIALNHVYDTSGSQGDGIELKQGSFDNWIVANLVHDTPYPCILVYGTGGATPNRIEQNVCYGSGDNVMQVQGEALVRNNLLMSGNRGFSSHDHQGQSRDLVFVHNTIVNTGRGAHLQSWNGRPGMVFANNVVYSQTGDAVRFANGSSGVAFTGNVVLGGVVGGPGPSLNGAGLADFEDVAWDASARDARPRTGGVLIGTGDAAWAVTLDLLGATRVAPLDSGAYDGP